MIKYNVIHHDLNVGFQLAFHGEVNTLEEAAALLSSPVDYIVAIEGGQRRELTEEENEALKCYIAPRAVGGNGNDLLLY